MKKLKIFQIDAFTRKPFTGNPAGVVKSDDLSPEEMQRIAAEMNLPETAFLASSENADYRLRWFTPEMEVDLCGHATIASMHFLKESGELKENTAVRFDTRSGILKCCDEKDFYYMQIPDYNMTLYNQSRPELLKLLGLKEYDIVGEMTLVSNGYLYIHVKNLDVLGSMHPDFYGLKTFSSGTNVKAAAVYTLETFEKGNNAHLRFFAPYFGINEDPVTGSANGPLINVLKYRTEIPGNIYEVMFEQGDFIKRPGRVKVLNKTGRTFIGGNAVTVIRGEITL